jgi:putative ABC transport system permease protein
MSVALLLLVSLIRQGARESFFGTVSGVDLIVGARTGGVNLLLYSVFRIGAATNNISWESYKDISQDSEISWIVPISLGDSHRGFRVIGTDASYFDHLKFRGDNKLSFSTGEKFNDVFDAVVGADVAQELGYQVGSNIILTHGVSAGGFGEHGDKPFRVAGVLNKTGTPIDRSIHVPLEAITAIHVDWQNGAPPKDGEAVSAQSAREMNLTPASITAAFVGLKKRIGVFKMQRFINNYSEEALMAVLPGVAMTELWQTVNTVEVALLAVTAMVIFAGLVALSSTLLSTLNERRREIAVLRAVGASPSDVFILLVSEAIILTLVGLIIGIMIAYGGVFVAEPFLEARFGLAIPVGMPGLSELRYLLIIFIAGVLSGVLPAYSAYRRSLSDGLSVRI